MCRIVGSVFQIHAHRTRADDTLCRFRSFFRRIAVTSFYIRADRYFDRAHDARHLGEHLLTRDSLAVWIAEAECYSGAGGGQGRKTGLRDDARAGRIPDVRQQQ
jgi:hypothetical protein